MRQNKGFTLIEMLITMGILLTVLTLASQGIVTIMKINQTQNAAAAAQAKLRSTSEAIELYIRGSTLGGLSAVPYAPSQSSISFASLTGSSGLQMTAASNTKATVLSSDLANTDFENGQALLVSGDGDAVAVKNVTVSAASSGRYDVNYDTCNNAAFANINNAKLHSATLHGFRYDAAAQELYYQSQTGAEVPVAFNISKFELEYIYMATNGGNAREILSTPEMVNGVPQKEKGNKTLRAVNILLEASFEVSGKTITRNHSSLAYLGDLGDTQSNQHSNYFNSLKGIKQCS